MPSMERDDSRDRDAVLRHSLAIPDNGRASIPMWDSSDPDRAPPPLPIHPGYNGPTTKANTSASIAAAARQIVEKARESAPLSAYTSNPPPLSSSPERSLIKGAHHKRMQSLQPGSVKDLRSYLDSNRSPERSPERIPERMSERPGSRGGYFSHSRSQSMDNMTPSPDRSTTPTRDPLKDTPSLRPSSRPPPRAILGENTPPSATMLALQTMHVPDPPLNDVTNGPSTPTGGTRVHFNHDFSNQLVNLTSIANKLEREMAQLSRRSKDNATDLLSLKEATNARDEDIRKSLRDLASSVHTQALLSPPPPPAPPAERSSRAYTTNFLDSKAFNTPPSANKSFTLPRAASAHSFLDDLRAGSPSPYSVEGAASVAMLEKIIREMVTKDGHERFISTISELLEKSLRENEGASKKMEELSSFIKEKSTSSALVPTRNIDGLNGDAARGMGGSSNVGSKATVDGEVMKMLQRIKDSVSLSGGTTAEVKGLVRDLRGEVLGMGRELGKKLDQIGESQLTSALDRSIHEGQGNDHVEEVQRVVEEGLTDLKSHLSNVMRQRAEQDDDTFRQLATTRSGANGEEMLAVVQHALSQHSRDLASSKPQTDDAGLDREGVLDAVKEGLKDFEPNIELQQFGLERDEILAVLKEGLEDYQNNRPEPGPANIDKGEIFEVMQEAMKDFRAPFPAEQIAQVKEDLIANVQQALEQFHPSPSGPVMDDEAIRAAVLETVKEGLENYGPAAPREIEISRDDLFDAVKASLDGSAIPFGGFGEQVMAQLRELIDGMRMEFKQYSAANGHDTEQVLDAVKDGLESLRAEIETYVDKAQDVTGKDEIVDTIKDGLEQLRGDVQGYCAAGPSQDTGKHEMLEYIKTEFEHLHDAIANQESSRDLEEPKPDHTAAIILAIKEAIDGLREHIGTRDLDEQSHDEMNEAMKEEFEQLKREILNAHAVDKSELVETIQDSMGALHSKLSGTELSAMAGATSDEVIQAMQDELAALKESIHEMISNAEKEGVASGVQRSIDEIRTQLSADQSDASAEALGAIKEELEAFKEAIGTSLVPTNNGENTETMRALQTSLDEVRDTVAKNASAGVSTELLEALRGEFETLRTSIHNSNAQNVSNDEVVDAVRLGLDDLRSHLEKRLDNPATIISHQSELLDTLHEGLDSLRTDIVKTLDKPLDQTVNYEILDTLKDGLAALRAGMDRLNSSNDDRPATPKGGEIVLADPGAIGQARDLSDESPAPAAQHDKHADFERMEVMIGQLQIKIEALDHTVQEMPTQQAAAPPTSIPEDSGVREQLSVLEGMMLELQDKIAGMATNNVSALEGMLRELQDTVSTMGPREEPAPEGVARKEDTDAIETLLRNTKSQLEDFALLSTDSGANREQLDELKAGISVTNDAIESLAEKFEGGVASKGDVAVVEVLVQDMKTAVDELKFRLPALPLDQENPEFVTKADLDVLGVLCTEIKNQVADMTIPGLDEMPSKSDIEQLHGLIADFRDSHDKMRDSYETDIAVTAKAFDDRKQEFEDTVAQIGDVKTLLEDVKTELFLKLGDNDTGINTLGETLKTIEERIGGGEVQAEMKEFMDKVIEEFDRAHESIENVKVDNAQSSETMFEKHSEHKDAIIDELGGKLDTLFDTIMTKYDDAQHVAEEKAKVMEEKATQQEELLNSTKTMAEDLRVSIDTLGTTITSFMGDLPTTIDKMTEESKTVFAQVVATHEKLEEVTSGLNGVHETTRGEVGRVMSAIDGVQSDLSEHNPRFMVMMEEVRALINSHYEHSRETSNVVREMHDSVKTGFEAQSDGMKSQNEELKTALPMLMPPPETPTQVEQYDDKLVHEKLDKLMGHVEEAASRSTQLQRLDTIHEKVMATAAEVTAFVAAQNKQITEDHSSKEREAEEIALLLERRLERKDQLEADITVLNEEKESLQSAVESLKAEKEALAAQKARISAEVSSMETALLIRRDELHSMDLKAAAIEKRILDGVMNQSRMLLLAKSKPPAPKKKPQGRDLRIPSDGSAVSANTVTSQVPALKANHALAMKSRGLQRSGPRSNIAERRIMSLNQINHNVPTGAHAYVPEKASLLSTHSMKRSHSVKSGFSKPSWAAKRHSLSAHNKENETLSEEDEDDVAFANATESHLDDSAAMDDLGSEAGTERRSSCVSRGTYATGSYLEHHLDDEDEEYEDDDRHRARPSLAESDMTYASSANGVVNGSYTPINEEPEAEAGAERDSDDEDYEEDYGDAEEEVQHDMQLALKAPPKLGSYAPPSDSGLGTEVASAVGGGDQEGHYRRR